MEFLLLEVLVLVFDFLFLIHSHFYLNSRWLRLFALLLGLWLVFLLFVFYLDLLFLLGNHYLLLLFCHRLVLFHLEYDLILVRLYYLLWIFFLGVLLVLLFLMDLDHLLVHLVLIVLVLILIIGQDLVFVSFLKNKFLLYYLFCFLV